MKGIDPSALVDSAVNLILSSNELCVGKIHYYALLPG